MICHLFIEDPEIFSWNMKEFSPGESPVIFNLNFIDAPNAAFIDAIKRVFIDDFNGFLRCP